MYNRTCYTLLSFVSSKLGTVDPDLNGGVLPELVARQPTSDVEVEPHRHLSLRRQSSRQVVVSSGEHLGSQLRLIQATSQPGAAVFVRSVGQRSAAK